MIILCEDDFLKQIPHLSGVYRYYDKDDTLLYVGKAINLYKRVSSYFRKSNSLSPRISIMVSQIHHIEITVTENELSALLLENNLIKNLKPKYNILFRDDKTYPLLKLTNHIFPRVEYFRGKLNKSDEFFGPYTSTSALKEAIDMIQKLFKIRTCSDSFFANRKRPCMLHQINLCTAPCVNYVEASEYANQVKLAVDFLNGKYSELIEKFTNNMYKAAEDLNFEVAASLRDKISVLTQMRTKQVINNADIVDKTIDIIAYKVINNSYLQIYLVMLRGGLYVGDRDFQVKYFGDLTESLEVFLEGYYINNRSNHLVYIDYKFSEDIYRFLKNGAKINLMTRIPKTLDGIYNMTLRNLEQNIAISSEDCVLELQNILDVTNINRIECYDISHHQGQHSVASMVVFQDGIVDNSLYRRYNLDDDINGNDILGMKTILNKRLLSDIPLPQVILLDGGRIQLDVLKKLLIELNLCDKIRSLAIFKGERRDPQLDTIITDNFKKITYRENQQLFKLLQELRDEAHRFAITGHRKKRLKSVRNSELDLIPLVGAKKRKALIAYFGSVKAISVASISDLQQVSGIGMKLATQIYDYFH